MESCPLIILKAAGAGCLRVTRSPLQFVDCAGGEDGERGTVFALMDGGAGGSSGDKKTVRLVCADNPKRKLTPRVEGGAGTVVAAEETLYGDMTGGCFTLVGWPAGPIKVLSNDTKAYIALPESPGDEKVRLTNKQEEAAQFTVLGSRALPLAVTNGVKKLKLKDGYLGIDQNGQLIGNADGGGVFAPVRVVRATAEDMQNTTTGRTDRKFNPRTGPYYTLRSAAFVQWDYLIGVDATGARVVGTRQLLNGQYTDSRPSVFRIDHAGDGGIVLFFPLSDRYLGISDNGKDFKTLPKSTARQRCAVLHVEDCLEADVASYEAGDRVNYMSRSTKLWYPAVVKGFTHTGLIEVTLTGEGKNRARAGSVKKATVDRVALRPDDAAPLFADTVGEWLLFGDSITQQSFNLGGWGARLAARYARRADFKNRGFSGYNTRWALHALDTMLRQRGGGSGKLDADVALVFFGANDATDPSVNPRQSIPRREYAANLRRIVDRLQSSSPDRRVEVILVSPPPIDEKARDRYVQSRSQKRSRSLKLAAEYAAACVAVAAEKKVPCLDLFTLMSNAPQGFSGFLSDGLHLSAEGSAFLYEELVKLIQSKLPDLAVLPDERSGSFANSGSRSEMPGLLPWHDNIDYKNSKKSFASKR